MAGEGHDGPETVRLPRPAATSFLIRIRAFGNSQFVCSNWLGLSDVTAPIFHTTNQREGDGRLCFRPTRKGWGTVFRSSQWAARGRGSRGSGGRNCREFQSASGSASMERAEALR